MLGILTEEATGGASAEREAGLIELLLDLRSEARKDKDWVRADRIRDGLHKLGVAVEDRPDGAGWRIGR